MANSLEEAAKIAAGNPCLNYGLFYEIRPIDPERATAFTVTTETPSEHGTDYDGSDIDRYESMGKLLQFASPLAYEDEFAWRVPIGVSVS